ncbi:hypothetical protein ACK8XC_000737 [Campylobacter upsaliensis]
MKEIQAKNLYGKGHEQRNERPYAIVYESKNYCLAFPKTTKDKRSRRYPSHKNFKLPDENEIMIDQLTIILNTNIIASDLSDFQTQLQQLRYGNTEIDSVIDSFCQYVILQNEKSNQTFQVQFGDIIGFKHSHPLLINQQYFIVLSNEIFHQSKMCCIAPYNKEDEDIDYSLLHCIDFEAREIVKNDNKECLKKDKIASEIKTLFLGNQDV